MNPIGIMQGRLSPRFNGRYQAFPVNHWKEEFSIAGRLGFKCIEFIYDYENCRENPLSTDEGIEEIKEVSRATGVRVFSICADYFMRFPLADYSGAKREERIQTLTELIQRAGGAGITDITLPCVDGSSLRTDEDLYLLKEGLGKCLPFAKEYEVNINLETDLPPKEFHSLVKDLGHPRIKINYDIGNSASLGYNPEEELEAYGEYISVLHVKDRLYQGGSVALGTGQADFETVFKKLKRIGFEGVIIMQAVRADSYDEEISFVKSQFQYLQNCLEKWFI